MADFHRCLLDHLTRFQAVCARLIGKPVEIGRHYWPLQATASQMKALPRRAGKWACPAQPVRRKARPFGF